MNALVTGGAGFIGSHLVDELMKDSRFKTVVVVDNLSSGKKENIAHHRKDSRFKFVKSDISNVTAQHLLLGHMENNKIDVVFHLAAAAGVPFSVKNPMASYRNNDFSTINVLEASRKANVRRVVFSSSSSIYGGSKPFPTVEETSAYLDFDPQSPYAQYKAVGEQFCKMYSKVYGLDTACLRYFNIFGPRQRPDSAYAAVIAAFVDCAVTKKKPKIHGTGGQFRDFTYVANAVEANILAGTCAEKLKGESFNVGTGSRITVNAIHKASGAPAAEYVESRAGDVHGSQAAINKIVDMLGYEVLIDFDEGMRLTKEWHQDFLKNGEIK